MFNTATCFGNYLVQSMGRNDHQKKNRYSAARIKKKTYTYIIYSKTSEISKQYAILRTLKKNKSLA